MRKVVLLLSILFGLFYIGQPAHAESSSISVSAVVPFMRVVFVDQNNSVVKVSTNSDKAVIPTFVSAESNKKIIPDQQLTDSYTLLLATNKITPGDNKLVLPAKKIKAQKIALKLPAQIEYLPPDQRYKLA